MLVDAGYAYDRRQARTGGGAPEGGTAERGARTKVHVQWLCRVVIGEGNDETRTACWDGVGGSAGG